MHKPRLDGEIMLVLLLSVADSECYRCRDAIAEFTKTAFVRKRKMNRARVSGSKSLENAASDAKREMEKKTADAAKAKKNALGKAVVARRAREFASVVVVLLMVLTVVDAELAFSINSSPRIFEEIVLRIDSSCLPVPSSGNSPVVLSGSRGSPNTSGSGKIEECPSSKKSENTDATVSKPSVHARLSDDSSPCIGLGHLKLEGLVYTKKCKKNKERWEKGGGIVGKCTSSDDVGLIFESQVWCRQGVLADELYSEDTGNQGHQNYCGNATILRDRRCNGKLDRYMLKYSKRPAGLKASSRTGTNFLDAVFYVESKSQSCNRQGALKYNDTRNQYQLTGGDGNAAMLHDGRCNGKLDRYVLKYTKRPAGLKGSSRNETKIVYDGFYVESKARAVGLTLNCSKECRILSGASFRSCMVPLQASACASGSSQDLF
ncbi:hypothetical protein Acr_00g0050850 [Actinidia rufa]|uniref:Uncharacterized protein n=1 Tax=Actinidia rufa TaxID=165716 RepID=A0A7J0DML5_9ERIC|nr:hypothetical protein Acr_00g0050850 [Actinidia rufa]